MKKQLLSVFAALAVTSVFAQTPAPAWATSQNANFTVTSAGIKFLDAVDANVVWASGYDGTAASRNYNWVSRSTNGGTSFTVNNVFADTNTYVMANMEAIDANTAWVCAFSHGAPYYTTSNPGGGGIFKTTNGGATWVNMTPLGMLTNTAQSFADFVSFLTPSVGIFVGDPVGSPAAFEIWRTTDGGSTWSTVSGLPAPGAAEYAITNLYSKQGTSNLWFGTNQGRIYRTTDGGVSWSAHTITASTTTITQVAFSSPLNGIVYGFDGSATVVFNTTDGGNTWSQITTLSANMGMNDIKAVPGSNYYVSVDNQNQLISYSTDNGVTWTNWGSTGIPYLTVDFASPTVGWAGSFSDQTVATTGGLWKYTGAALTTTATPPTAGFTISTNVCGPTVTLTPFNSSTGSGTLTYAWSGSSGAVFSSTSAASPSISFASAGSYTVNLVATNAVGTHSSSQVVNIVACSAPTASFVVPSTSPCNLAAFSTTATTTSGVPTAGYVWTANPSNGVTFLPSAAVASPSVKAQNAGTYTLTLVASNIAGSVVTTQTINVNDCRPVPTFTLPVSACRGDTVFAFNQTQPVAGASNNTYTWTWAPTSGIAQSNTSTPFPQSKRFIFTGSASNVYTITLKSSNSSGTASVVQTISVTACTTTTTGIEVNTLSEQLNVYPNPAHDVLNVTLPASQDGYTIKLLNVLGAVMHEEKAVKGSVSINLANKAKGIYFLNVEANNNERVTRKIVIE